ncbi:amidase signature enzyme [Sarocladium strictum]
MLLQSFWLLATASIAFGVEQPSSFAPSSDFDVRGATIDSIHEALYSGEATCRDVVSAFIARIEEFNPQLNAVISLNPSALDDADRLDAARKTGDNGDLLHCIPLLLKDNYDAIGMPTTAGSRALAHIQPTTEGPVVAALKSAGAIILGKANMHEMALEGISVSSLGGQALNPYDLSRTPGGSSGGSGVAVAADLAILATGTDTVNSLRSPASANNLFSFRPTRGLISRAGVIPVGHTQDALGAMGRSVKDVATVLEVMASVGYDARDKDTALRPGRLNGHDYRSDLFGGRLRGLRLGVLSGAYDYTPSPEATPVINAMENMERLLRDQGVELVNVTKPIFDMSTMTPKVDVQSYEFRELLDEYLQRRDLIGEPRPRSLSEIYSGDDFFVLPYQYEHIKSAHTRSTSDTDYIAKMKLISELTEALHEEFRVNRLDAIIYPEQRNLVVKVGSPSQVGRNGILAAVTGFPVVVVPAGWSEADDHAPLGVPIGMDILGLPWTEDKLLNIAQAISDRTTKLKKSPVSTSQRLEGVCYENVPKISPVGLLPGGPYALDTLN